MELTTEKACLCALNRIFGFEPKTGLALISSLGSATEVFALKRSDIDYLLGPYSRYRDSICAKSVADAETELLKMEKKGITFIGWSEEEYPQLLKECPDAPIGLYIDSAAPEDIAWNSRRAVSIVGTRDLSSYGREWCCRIVGCLGNSLEKPLIISGLAIGTDICAHRKALEAGLPTIAVMATGADIIYPSRHAGFAEQIRHSAGSALVTDYPPGTRPLAVHFLRRNRIIAGLGEATLLIESKIRGGGMMTANLAFSYGREVYAVPGRIDDTCSQGCNSLIKARVAEAVTGSDEFLVSLRMRGTGERKRMSDKDRIAQTYGERLPKDRIDMLAKTLLAIRRQRGISVEELSHVLGLNIADTSRMTGMLEAEGFIDIDLLQRCCINVNK